MVPPFFGFFRPLRFRMFQILFSGLALSVKSFGFASSPKGRALGKEMKFAWRGLPKAPTLRKDFPRPGEDVTAGDKKGNLASRSDD